MQDSRGPKSGYSPVVSQDEAERFMQHVEKVPESGCWVWMLSLNKFGYGQFVLRLPKRRPYPTHRISYVIHNGPIEPGLVIDHKCRVRACVNPDHLRMVTQDENMGPGWGGKFGFAAQHRAKTCCPKCGGDYSKNTKGHRICRPCAKAGAARRYKQKKLKQAAT
jgi:hypothetical protein